MGFLYLYVGIDPSTKSTHVLVISWAAKQERSSPLS
jgi:hypothetical protein